LYGEGSDFDTLINKARPNQASAFFSSGFLVITIAQSGQTWEQIPQEMQAPLSGITVGVP
jgi:hypothetical protein